MTIRTSCVASFVRLTTQGSGEATPGDPVQFATSTPSWYIGIVFTFACFGISDLSSRNPKRSGRPGENVCSIVIVETWPKHVADGPHPSLGTEAFDSERAAGVPSAVAGIVAVVTCGFDAVAPVPGSVVSVSPAGGTKPAT